MMAKKTNAGLTPMPISIAPMMGYTDRYFRYFMRQMTGKAHLYTEMITTSAVMHGDHEKLLGFLRCEKPLTLQLGGDSPEDLALCSEIAARRGYDEVNLNVGCPSHRVQEGHFGACLMANPELVAAAVRRMHQAASLPVTVKCRIGIDALDRYEDLHRFIGVIAAEGCRCFIIHARKAHLKGLSPKENRTIPPLRYDLVYEIKRAFPELTIVINGGIGSIEEAEQHLCIVDGVMLGRISCDHPYLLASVDARFYNAMLPVPSRLSVVQKMIPYIEDRHAEGIPPRRILRHMSGLYNGQPFARAWRRAVNQIGNPDSTGIPGSFARLEDAAIRIEEAQSAAALSGLLV